MLLKTVAPGGSLFEALGPRYFGPVNGHDIAHLISILSDLKRHPGFIMLHVITNKGQGHVRAASDPIGFHGVSPKVEPSRAARPRVRGAGREDLEQRVRRGRDRARQARPGPPRDHGGDARQHRRHEVPEALPRAHARRRHLRAARRRVRLGPPQGRQAPGLRDLLDVPPARVRPDLPGGRAQPRAGRVLPRPRRASSGRTARRTTGASTSRTCARSRGSISSRRATRPSSTRCSTSRSTATCRPRSAIRGRSRRIPRRSSRSAASSCAASPRRCAPAATSRSSRSATWSTRRWRPPRCSPRRASRRRSSTRASSGRSTSTPSAT